MKKVKVLHLASFSGNIGDNANHKGSRKALNEYKHILNFDFTNEEIREYYWRNKKFDDNFAKKCNQYDLVLIGGGNYLEFHIHHSRTGTSIDIPKYLLKKINVPIVFFSLGCECSLGYKEETFLKSKSFIDFIISLPNRYYLSVRNDGAHYNIKKYYGKSYIDKFTLIPDSGFLIEKQETGYNLKKNKKYIGVNIAGDSLDVRFKSNRSKEFFLNSFAKFI